MLIHEEIQALAAYASENGRSWKAKLRDAWTNASEPGTLQALRNSSWFGPAGLIKFNLKQAVIRDGEREAARAYLLSVLKPGSLVYTVNTHVARSGMSAHIKVQLATTDGILNLSGYVSTLLGWKWCDDGSVDVGGCGLDRGHHLVYHVSRALFHDKFTCIGNGCPSNDHVNGDRDYTPHKHSDGGYALRQAWA